MTTTKLSPHILLVPGLWEGPSVYSPLLSFLHARNFPTTVIPLLSTGYPSPSNPSMKDDVARLREKISEVISSANGTEVLLVLHSAAGFLGSMAVRDLTAPERKTSGLSGGVVGIVFLAGAVWAEGFQHGPLPFFDYQASPEI